jgi:hypothetical protein
MTQTNAFATLAVQCDPLCYSLQWQLKQLTKGGCQNECSDVMWTQMAIKQKWLFMWKELPWWLFEPTTFGEHDQCSYRW